MKRVIGLLMVAAVQCWILSGAAIAQVSDNVVKIGVMDDFTGPYAENGDPGTWRPPAWPLRCGDALPEGDQGCRDG